MTKQEIIDLASTTGGKMLERMMTKVLEGSSDETALADAQQFLDPRAAMYTRVGHQHPMMLFTIELSRQLQE